MKLQKLCELLCQQREIESKPYLQKILNGLNLSKLSDNEIKLCDRRPF